MNEKLIRYLVEAGLITPEQAKELWEEHRGARRSVRDLLVEKALVPEDRIVEALSQLSRIPRIRLYEPAIPPEVRRMVPPDLLRTNQVLPFDIDPDDPGALRVAICDPMNMRGRDVVAHTTRMRVRPYLATSVDIMRTIDRYFGSQEMQAAAEQFNVAQVGETPHTLEEELQQADVNASPVVVLVNSLVEQAVRMRASDIHIEPGVDQVRVRFRVDGVLYRRASYEMNLLPAIITRIKIISGMRISEKHKPQDGSFSLTVDHLEYDLRVSTLPTTYGEKCVMRLAQKRALSRDKESLGLVGEDLEKFDKILARPNGIFLVTGPTGSGKSTTLYTALSGLNSESVNIVTVEDPVEAHIDGVNQIQVNPKADMTFANVLRSILRQDPDIIMIGEIRDGETAAIAVQASITGHLVVSTLHTNDTASSVTRLLDMGVESFLIADATVGIVAQRLVRRLCPNCKRSRPMLPYEADYLNVPEEERENAVLWEPVGCARCGSTGFLGRIGVYEIMEITPALRALIARRASTDELREQAVREGMHTLRESASRLVREGITHIGELHRINMEGDFPEPSGNGENRS